MLYYIIMKKLKHKTYKFKNKKHNKTKKYKKKLK